jgi:F-type H+-transporting ATPase subunit b
MNTIVTILNSLKIDNTFLIQFVLFLVFFNVIAPILFNKLQEILELRESKTSKLDSHANDLYKKVEELQEKYKASVEKTHQDSQVIASKKKSEILAKEREVLTGAENKMTSDYEAKRAQLLKEMNEKRTAVLSEASVLSNSLVEKLTK